MPCDFVMFSTSEPVVMFGQAARCAPFSCVLAPLTCRVCVSGRAAGRGRGAGGRSGGAAGQDRQVPAGGRGRRQSAALARGPGLPGGRGARAAAPGAAEGRLSGRGTGDRAGDGPLTSDGAGLCTVAAAARVMSTAAIGGRCHALLCGLMAPLNQAPSSVAVN